ncbi:unnamed protein product [Calypogeia fissa]
MAVDFIGKLERWDGGRDQEIQRKWAMATGRAGGIRGREVLVAMGEIFAKKMELRAKRRGGNGERWKHEREWRDGNWSFDQREV